MEVRFHLAVFSYLHCGRDTKSFTMARTYLTILLPKFHGEGSEDPKKHLFICEKI
jgi:hypothetical protein